MSVKCVFVDDAYAYLSTSINLGYNKLAVLEFSRIAKKFVRLAVYDTKLAKKNYILKYGIIERWSNNAFRCRAVEAFWLFCKGT